MPLSLRRLGAIFVVLLTLTPVLAGAAETGKAKPVAWLALDRKSTRLNSSHSDRSRMPSSA